MGSQEQVLIRKIEEAIELAERAETDLERLSYQGLGVIDEPDEDFDDAAARLIHYLTDIFRDLRILAERLKVPHLREEIASCERSFSSLANMDFLQFDEGLQAPALHEAKRYFNSMQSLTGVDTSRLSVFQTILENTGKIITDSSEDFLPDNETKVRNEVLRIAKYAFRDAAKEIPLPGSIKHYRGDIGVRSLMAVAEYKYADSESKVKSCLDGIYSDMMTYRNDGEWQHFFAVFFMTEPFFTQRDLEHDFSEVGSKANWTPIVINYSGKK